MRSLVKQTDTVVSRFLLKSILNGLLPYVNNTRNNLILNGFLQMYESNLVKQTDAVYFM